VEPKTEVGDIPLWFQPKLPLAIARPLCQKISYDYPMRAR